MSKIVVFGRTTTSPSLSFPTKLFIDGSKRWYRIASPRQVQETESEGSTFESPRSMSGHMGSFGGFPEEVGGVPKGG